MRPFQMCFYAGAVTAILGFFNPGTVRADARLIGTWAPSNIPITVPAGASLTITASGSGYSATPTAAFTVPAPVNCLVDATTQLAQFSPLSKSRFNINFTGLLPVTCTPVALDSIEAEITFDSGNTSFIACQTSGRCSSWVRIGSAPDPISTKTVPTTPTVTAGKTSLAVAWETLPGVTAYIIKLNGPAIVSKTAKKGNSIKFTGLAKGTYKVTLTGTFKDTQGKIKNTRTTKAIKAIVTGGKKRIRAR